MTYEKIMEAANRLPVRLRYDLACLDLSGLARPGSEQREARIRKLA